jgi:hypothetical protein
MKINRLFLKRETNAKRNKNSKTNFQQSPSVARITVKKPSVDPDLNTVALEGHSNAANDYALGVKCGRRVW